MLNNEDRKAIPIMTAISALTAAFTTTHATNLFTDASHGLEDGNVIKLTTSGADLPNGLLTTVRYFIINATTNTFQVALTKGGDAVTFSDDGTGTHTYHQIVQGIKIKVAGYHNFNFMVDTASSFDGTFKFVGSDKQVAPNFEDIQAVDNSYDYLTVLKNYVVGAISGTTGVNPGGTDIHHSYTLNVANLEWLTIVIEDDFTAGALTATVKLSN